MDDNEDQVMKKKLEVEIQAPASTTQLLISCL